MAKVSNGMVVGAVLLAILLAAYFNLLPLSVFPIDNVAYQNQPFHIRFFSGTYEITHSGTCPQTPNTDGFLVQTVTVHDDTSGENWGPTVNNAQPSCASLSYQWPDFVFTPLYTHHYTITSTVRDGTSNAVLNTDTWPFQVQASTAPECTAGQVRCDFTSTPDRLQLCDATGHYTTWGAFCAAGCSEPTPGAATCNQVCAPGTYQCTSQAQFQYCNPDGLGWANAQTCPYTWPLTTSCVEGQTSPCVQATAQCGDGICSPGETCTSCAGDCCGGGPICGNGVCETGETAASCRPDCDACSQDPADMTLTQRCACFPDLVECQSPGQIDNNLLIYGILAVIVIAGGIIVVVNMTKKR